jgi:hypothetical protein
LSAFVLSALALSALVLSPLLLSSLLLSSLLLVTLVLSLFVLLLVVPGVSAFDGCDSLWVGLALDWCDGALVAGVLTELTALTVGAAFVVTRSTTPAVACAT